MGRLTEYFARLNKPNTRRRAYLGASMSRRVGPLEKNYDPTGLPFRMRCGDRIAQLIVAMKRLYAAGDFAEFGGHIPEFRLIYDALHEPGWADEFLDIMWSDWKDHEQKQTNTYRRTA